MKEQGTQDAKNRRHNEVTFRAYEQNQGWLLPPTLGELIPQQHIVRLVNDAIEGMDLDPILNTYKGGGRSNYHPRLMLKALVYGYIDKRYSSRDIERAVRENICYMWLCGMQQPDHHTLNRFRNSQLKQTVKDVFAQVLALLVEQGYVRLEEYYIDGTKIESVAGRYTYVFAKNTKRYKGALIEKIGCLIEQIEAANEAVEVQETQAPKSPQTQVSDSDALKDTIIRLNKKLKEQQEEDKKLRGQLHKLTHEHLPKLMEYERQEAILGQRSSYAKTDPDATFMRTKDDHLGKGQLKPCYNIQTGTENQFIVNCTVHQSPSDMASFIPHLDDTLEVLQGIEAPLPKRLNSDAGYGCEQNYEYLQSKEIEGYLKYPGYYQEQSEQRQNNPFHPDNLHYNEQDDYYVCPMGQHMTLRRTYEENTSTGYAHTVSEYQAQRCEGCPMRGQCHAAKTERTLQVNHRAAAYRKAAKQKLNSLRGIQMRRQRSVDTEPVFGHIKQCRHFRRFLLRGLGGVTTEVRLLAIAHNLKKWWVMQCKLCPIVSMKPLPPAAEMKIVPMRAKIRQLTPLVHLKRA